MGCPISLRTTTLPNSEAGGTWQYDGSSTSPSSPPTSAPIALTGDNPTINSDDYPAGILFFTYTGIECGESVTKQITINNSPAADAGGDATDAYCTNDSQTLILRDLLSGTPQVDLTWTSTGATPPPSSFNAATGTFDLSLVNSAAVYIFEATASPTTYAGYPADPNCDDCEDKTATLTITINEGGEAGDATNEIVCNTDTANLFALHNANNGGGLSGLSFDFFGYRAGTSGAFSNGTFSINGAAAQSHSTGTDIPNPTDISNFSANGQYLFTISAGTAPCLDGSTILITVETCSSPCTVNVTATYDQTNTILESNVTGCTGAVTYQWQVLSGSSWQSVSGETGQNYTNPAAGEYRVIATCPDGNGCTDTSNQVTVSATCNVTVNISASGSSLTSSVTNCTGNISYIWQYRATSSSSWSTVSNSQNHTAANTGYYRLIAICDGCSATSNTLYYEDVEPCAFNVSITESSSTGNLTANVTGCTGTITYSWQYSTTGTGWSSTGQTTQIISPNNGNGFYRVVVNCTENGQTCPGAATYNYQNCTLPCNGDWIRRQISEVENHQYIISGVNAGETYRTVMISFKIDGIEQLTSDVAVEIDSSNIVIFNFGGSQIITNLVSFLNSVTQSYGIVFTNFGIQDYTSPSGRGYTMRAKYPACQTWEIKLSPSYPAGTGKTYMSNDNIVLINQDGLSFVGFGGQNYLNGDGTNGVGDYIDNQFAGFYFQETGNDC